MNQNELKIKKAKLKRFSQNNSNKFVKNIDNSVNNLAVKDITEGTMLYFEFKESEQYKRISN